MTVTAINTRLLAICIAVTLTSVTTEAVAQPKAQKSAEKKQSTEAAEESAEASTDKATSARRNLIDRIRSVQRKTFLKKKRVELYPYLAMDLNDPFYQHYVAGAALAFHLADSFALELRGGAVLGSVEQNSIKLVRVKAGAICEDCPQFKYHGDLNMGWAPIYGKLSLFGESILHFDTYFSVGGGVFATDAGVNPAINLGIGQRYFLSDWVVARVEVRDYVFMDSRNEIADIQNLVLLSLSVSGFFPTSFEYEFR
jgi:outer membrane beta-barrel protein